MNANRRALLGSIAAVGVAGCLSAVPGAESDAGRDYEECTAPYVEYDDLPTDLAAEVDAAFAEGAYVTDETPLYEQAVGDGTPLWRTDTPYEHRVERDGDTRRLTFEEQTAYDSPRDLKIENPTDDRIAVSATITDEDGERVLDVTGIEVAPDDNERLEAVSQFGTYEVDVELEDGRRETKTWTLTPPKGGGVDALVVSIAADGISIAELEWAYDFRSCRRVWNGS